MGDDPPVPSPLTDLLAPLGDLLDALHPEDPDAPADSPTDEHPAAPPLHPFSSPEALFDALGDSAEPVADAVTDVAALIEHIEHADVHDLASGIDLAHTLLGDLCGVSEAVADVLGTDAPFSPLIGEEAARVVSDVAEALGAAARFELPSFLAPALDASPTSPLAEVTVVFALPSLPAAFTVRELSLTEALHAPWVATVDVLTADELAPAELPGVDARVALLRGSLLRERPGVVAAVDDLGVLDERRLLRLTVVPRLWRLGLNRDSRIFQDLDATEIVRAVLRDAALYTAPAAQCWANVRRPCLRREYCVQYQESDLAFLTRLLEEEGIGYAFTTGEDGEETVVFFDRLADLAEVTLVPGAREVPLRGEESRTAADESIRLVEGAHRSVAGGVTLREYDFTRPDATELLTARHPQRPRGPVVFEHPGRFTLVDRLQDSQVNHAHAYEAHDGGRRAEVRAQQLQSERLRLRGGGNVTGFAPGLRFEVSAPGRDELDGRSFALLRVEHHFRASEATRAAGDDGPAALAEGYANTFECLPVDAPWRPPLATSRPRIHGVQTAVVVAPEGEEIHVDTHGRVKVRFHWDHAAGVRDERRSCWIRVAQAWAGAHWGFSFVPRRGMEVVVQYVEGDPDRPLVVGCVNNGTHPTPWALPEEKTRSGIRTMSTPAGDPSCFNELGFDDLAGRELLWLRAQRDLLERVLRDRTSQVGHDDTHTVGGDRKATVTHNDSLTVQETQTTVVGSGDAWEAPAPGAALKVVGQWSAEVSEKICFKVGGVTFTQDAGSLTVSAPLVIRFCVGASELMLTPSAALLSAPAVNVTASGAALSMQEGACLTSADGAKVSLTKDAEVRADSAKIFSKNASVKLDADVTIKGGTIKLNS